ncbi:N/A [soil metagenome]
MATDESSTPTTSANPFYSIGRRLVRKVVLLAVFCALAAMTIQVLYGISKARAAFIAEVAEITRTRVPLLAAGLRDGDSATLQAMLDDIAKSPRIEGVQLTTEAGTRMQAGRKIPRDGNSSAAIDINPLAAADSKVSAGQASARLFISLDYSHLIRQVMIDTALTALFIGLFTGFLCLLLIRFLHVEISVPLQRLSQHVNSISPDGLNEMVTCGRSPRPWRDELDQLADGFASLHASIARYAEERIHVEAALADERDRLELRVEERTRDLAAARDRADRANRSKSEFLANMSHEIRTPINAIAGFTTLALRTELNTQQSAYLEKINTATKSLLLIINDVLDYSRIEAGHLDMENIPFRLGEVIDTVVSYVGPLAERKGLELLIHVEPGLPQQWRGDPLRLGQILVNLCGNAVKFTELGEVEVHVAMQSRTADAARLLFAVRDTGIGLNPDQSARLFQAFTQADASTTRKFGGTGLGLAISQRLVEMMKGRIWLKSREAQGSTFFFEVELSLNIGASEVEQIQLPAALQGQAALVVDDNANARDLLATQLSELGMHPYAVASGEAALEELRKASLAGHPYPLVLMDWKMPGMDGVAATKAIRSDPAIGGTPVVIMVTAFGREQVMSAPEDAALLDDILLKPITTGLLTETLRRTRGLADQSEKSAKPELRPQVAPTALPILQLKGVRILLVEDNPINQQLAQELLEQEGAEVRIADNGRIALEALHEAGMQYFDALLVDLQMPEMDGYETTRRIRQMPSGDGLPLIAMTAHAMREERERCLAAGMQDHVAKPIDMDLLIAKLKQWIGAEGMLRAARRSAKIKRAAARAAAEFSPKILPPLAGVDIRSGLARCNGNEKLFQDLLSQFHQLYAGAATHIQRLCAEGKTSEAHMLAHTIKGAAANLAMPDLAAAAAALESALQADLGLKERT